MIIDPLASSIAPQALDSKIEKKSDPAESKPIEASGGSDNAKLDIEKQKTGKNQTAKSMEKSEGVLTYNAYGNAEPKKLETEQNIIDIVT